MALTQGFKDTMTAAVADPASADYDKDLKAEIDAYAARFKGQPGFPDPLDWQLFKAQLLIESGGPKGKVWKGRVLQIGNSGDPGLSVVRAAVRDDLTASEGADLVLPASLKAAMKDPKQSIEQPLLNLRVGLCYLFARMLRNIRDEDIIDTSRAPETYTVLKGDSWWKIARHFHVKVKDLQDLNSSAVTKGLRPGMDLHVRWGRHVREPDGWRTFDYKTIAERYNGNGNPSGDPAYAEKLEFVHKLLLAPPKPAPAPNPQKPGPGAPPKAGGPVPVTPPR